MQHDTQWSDRPELHIALAGKSKTDTLLETVSFLSDFNIAYELARLASDERYSNFTFSNYVWMRNGRPLDREDRLRVVRLKETSPLELVTSVAVAVAAALPAILILLNIVERAYNLPLNHRKLRAEVEKAERENRIARQAETDEIYARAEWTMGDARAAKYLEQTTHRLSRSTVIISEMTITYHEVHKKDAD